MKDKLINNENEINDTFNNIKELVINSRRRVYSTVNKGAMFEDKTI